MRFRLLFVCLMLWYSGYYSQTVKTCSFTAELNQKMIAFVNKSLHTKVGEGECWDLAAQALDLNQAKWNHEYEFGRELSYQSGDCLMPGDILQFEGVTVVHQSGNTMWEESYTHHTAIIYAISKNGDIKLAQQNTSEHGKKVSIDAFNFKWVTKGKIKAFRPQP